MNQTKTVLEQLSALADGQLRDAEFAEVVTRVCSDPELQASWRTYHLVGDVLRSGGHTPCSDSSAFVARLQQRLAAESADVAPPMAQPQRLGAVARSMPREVAQAANEPVFRWKLVAGAASIAAAAAIGWTWMGSTGAPGGAQLAQQQTPVSSVLAAAGPSAARSPAVLAPTRVLVGNGEAQVMLRDPRLDELLEAHQQVSGSSQMPSGFLRNATFEAPGR